MSKDVQRLFIYLGLLVCVAAIYLGIRAFGDTLAAPTPPFTSVGTKLSQVHVNDFVHVLLALALIIAAARALGAIFRLVQQPPVIGEMIAGIMLGPSLLGHLAPGFAAYILPQTIAPLLNVISQFGVILYMFLVGLELDISSLRHRAHSTIAISHASIVTPFLLGAGLALILYPALSNNAVSFTSFSLFLGVSMSVTAFPVLARILTDRRIHKTRMGILTLACAAVDDVTAWCLLAFVVSVTQSRTGSAVHTLLLAVVYIAVMLLLARPLMARLTSWIETKGRLTQGALALTLLGILFSSLATESIGIHSIFGAFVLGAIVPHGSLLARELTGKLEDFVVVFLLPAFFAFTGLRTQIGLVSGPQQWLFCVLIILVACIGKFGGSAIAARLSGLGWRDASAVGILMNTRGLMELIVLNLGLELHVISPTLFAMLVIMALTTTLATSPILSLITPRRMLEEEAKEIEEGSRLGNALRERNGTLIPITGASGIGGLLDLAVSLSPPLTPAPRVLALIRGSSVSGASPRLRETETFSPSRSPVLAAALDAAWVRGLAIRPEAVWTNDTTAEIINAAERSTVRWLLLESRRSIFGRYPRRSVVKEVINRLSPVPINVAVLTQPSEGAVLTQPIEKRTNSVVCVVKQSHHGKVALELADALAQNRHKQICILVLQADQESDGLDLSPYPGAWVQAFPNALASGTTIVSCNKTGLAEQLGSGWLVIAKDAVDACSSLVDQLTTGRSVVVVQGGGTPASKEAQHPFPLEELSLPAV